MKVISSTIFIASFALAIYLYVKQQNTINLAILSVYVLSLIVSLLSLVKRKNTGEVITKKNIASLEFSLVDQFGTLKKNVEVEDSGKFELFLTPGQYSVLVREGGKVIKSIAIEVKKPMFLNKKLSV